MQTTFTFYCFTDADIVWQDFLPKATKKQTACQRQKMSRKKKCRSRAEFHIGTQMAEVLR